MNAGSHEDTRNGQTGNSQAGGAAMSAAQATEMRLHAIIAAARYHGAELAVTDFRARPGEAVPSPAALVGWLRDNGFVAKAERLKWRQLFKLGEAPVVLLFNDGAAGVLVGSDAARSVVWLKDPRAQQGDAPVAVDELRLSQVWNGEVVLVRRARGAGEQDAPFNIAWLARVVLQEKKSLKDVCIASLTLSALTLIPPLLVMQVIDRVITHHSISTLVLLTLILSLVVIYETLLGFARRELVQVVSVRIDTRLNLHSFARLLSLPLDFFESHQTGETVARLSQIWKIRDFMTGKLMGTFLDSFTLVFLLPFLFWLNATLAWIVMAAAGLIAVVIMIFLKPIALLMGKVVAAENRKGTVLVESVHGIRTVKTLALEPQRKELWDERVAEAGELRLQVGRLSNWPQTIIVPIEMFISRGVILVGCYFVLAGDSSVAAGSLVAFMMLGARVTQPLVGLAKLMEDITDVRASVGEVGAVLNNPTETKALTTGMRPRLAGHLSFEDVTFVYPRSKVPALDRVTFDIPPGTMVGVVGRSGSGKSTITRLLQGVNREYSGYLKIDGAELRELNLTHLRRSLGIVLQDNFLFRGTVRDNITAGRPGMTLEDVVRAARMAGAEEFIERLPQGYETWIEEGSTNISGGQRQRLAIARAVISDPRIMILDEATSALDPESEALVNANLQRIAKNRTMVIVSHRLSSLLDCHLILVMDRGKVMDIGPHADLVERCSVYRTLWMQQNRHLDNAGRPPAPTPALAQGDD